MTKINILNCSLITAQGDLASTLNSIKNNNIKISSKNVLAIDDYIDVPYFSFENKIKRNKQDITSAISKIAKDLVKSLNKLQKSKTALIIGTALVDINTIEAVEDTTNSYQNNPEQFTKSSIDSFAQDTAKELQLNNFTMTICTACTSSVNAILEAKNLISANIVDYAVIIGVDIFSKIMSCGFSSMGLLSSSSQKPFDLDRDGLILGEAIAGILIGSDDSPWEVLGGYSNCDSETITAVSPSGKEFNNVMQRAMKHSNISASEITAIKAHATSSPSNDLAEINAISNIFDESITITALKPYIGHTLGACGVLELIIMIICVDNGFIPKTIDCKKPILNNYQPISNHKNCNYGTFMLNYFGFGGNNTVIIIKKSKKI